ncbi:phospholipase D-like domain-containing protein [Mameliella sp.]|uniref:phospholipase D-like domain-containing protein n=1 Tax=Mameliella sp. TaxID=1924940 RepID=UPI003B51037F
MTTRALLSAGEAGAALETLAAGARSELLLCLPRLAPDSPLVLPDLRHRGLATWGDLLALQSRRGLSLRILVAEPDPLLSPQAHRAAWRRASGLADVLQGSAQLVIAPHGHVARGPRGALLRRRLRPAMTALRAEDMARLTPVQRALVQGGANPRPAEIHQGFALADGANAIIGGPDLGTDTPSAISLQVSDPDFCGALRGHFADCWAEALKCGATLAAPANARTCPTRPQSRDDLRLLRTLSRPTRGFAPRTLANDAEPALARLFGNARRRILIRTGALRHDGLTQALTAAAQTPDLQLILLLPPEPQGTWDDARAAALQGAALSRLQNAYGDRLALVADPQAEGMLCLVDGTTVIGSHALTRRACRWNSEAAALVRDECLAERLLAHLGAGLSGDLDRAATWAAQRPAPPLAEARPHRSLLPDDLF